MVEQVLYVEIVTLVILVVILLLVVAIKSSPSTDPNYRPPRRNRPYRDHEREYDQGEFQEDGGNMGQFFGFVLLIVIIILLFSSA
ncbi:MAG: hypothetical protein R3A44_20490 [Caldilineaceae bacterium]